MDTNVYSLVQSQRATDVVVTECKWDKTEHARFKQGLYNVWLDQTEWSRNKGIKSKAIAIKCYKEIKITNPLYESCNILIFSTSLVPVRLELRLVQEEANIDLTGEGQHGFKKTRSTSSLSLNIQTIISQALDDDNHAIMASLDKLVPLKHLWQWF